MKKFLIVFVVFLATLSLSLDIPQEFGESKTIEYKVKVVMADGIRIYYPQFSTEHENLNKIIYNFVEERWKSNESALLNQMKIYKKGITSGRPEYYLVFSVERLDSKIVSILFEEMTYTGGAHPIHFLHAINYDLKYGKELALNDLFVKGFDCKKIINEEVKKFFERNKCSVINDFKTIKNEQDFYLTDYGIMIFFQRYEYTNYSFGNPKIPIPYGRFGRFFKKEYLP